MMRSASTSLREPIIVSAAVGRGGAVPAKRITERLRRIWDAAIALDQPAAYPVRRYLEKRGLGQVLQDPPKLLRAHSALAYFDRTRGELGLFPAMLALFRNAAGDAVTVHATYLQSDGSGKAPVPPRAYPAKSIAQSRGA